MQPLQMGAALNYLGQPITAGQLPSAVPNGQGIADINALSAAYAMQGMQMPGLVSTANMMHHNQPLLLNNNEIPNGMTTLPSKKKCDAGLAFLKMVFLSNRVWLNFFFDTTQRNS